MLEMMITLFCVILTARGGGGGGGPPFFGHYGNAPLNKVWFSGS